MDGSLANNRSALLISLVLAAASYFAGLGTSSLWDSNEAFYAQTPREMIQSGDYLNPSFNYRPRFNKPPLCYWMVALFYRMFGVSELTERIPIAVGALVVITTAFLIARTVYSTEAGVFAALAAAANPRFFMFSRRIIIDVFLTMFLGLALLFFILSESAGVRGQLRGRKVALLLMYVCVGLGVLTKGPVAIALPGAVILIYLLSVGSAAKIRSMMLPVGAIVIAAVVLPWYLLIYREHGWVYIESFIIGDNISRYTDPVWGPRRGLFFYIPVLLGDLFPWSIILVFGAGAFLTRLIKRYLKPRSRTEGGPESTPHRRNSRVLTQQATLLLALWIIVIVTFFSLSRNKEDLYILPVYPVAAALTGHLLSAGGSRWPLATIGLLLSVAGAVIAYLFGSANASYVLDGAIPIGAVLLVGGALGCLFGLRFKTRHSVAALGLAIAATLWLFALVTLPSFERFKPVRTLCKEIRARAGADALVGYYKFAAPSMVFYLERPIFEYYNERDLELAFASDADVYCVISARDYHSLEDSLRAKTHILASVPVFQVKLGGIFDRAEPAQVLLISKRSGVGLRQ